MATPNPIHQELSAAEEALKTGNDGRARVCARRAVALADEAWLTQHATQAFRGDSLAHLRRIQGDGSLPSDVREAAERLSTAVTQKDFAPFSVDPIGDARLIIAYLTA